MVGKIAKLADGWLRCVTHDRLLTYPEYMIKACYWCNPRLAPPKHKIHKLNQEELDELVVQRIRE